MDGGDQPDRAQHPGPGKEVESLVQRPARLITSLKPAPGVRPSEGRDDGNEGGQDGSPAFHRIIVSNTAIIATRIIIRRVVTWWRRTIGCTGGAPERC